MNPQLLAAIAALAAASSQLQAAAGVPGPAGPPPPAKSLMEQWAGKYLGQITSGLSGSAGQAVGSAFGSGAGSLAGAGVEKALTGIVGKLGPAGAVLAAGTEGLKQFTKFIVEGAAAQQAANFRLAEFSAAMADVAARSHFRDVMRNMEKGNATAGSAGYLANSDAAYKDSLKHIEILMSNLSNYFFGTLLQGLADLLSPLGEIARDVNKMLPSMGTANGTMNFAEWMMWIKKGEEEVAKRGDDWLKRQNKGLNRPKREL